MEVTTSVQKYAWGKLGRSSLVSKLAAASVPDFQFSDTDRYAELWIGTHPNGPSKLVGSKQTLDEFIKGNPIVLGDKVLEKFGPNLPFLFKILSVNTALSIQAHPDLVLAKKLHETFPDVYKDANHKPEMAVAISDFELLCGFRSIQEIAEHLKVVPELRQLVGEDAAKELETNLDKAALKSAFAYLVKSNKESVAKQLSILLARLDESVPEYELIRRLSIDYPGDVGIFGVYFLQHFVLQPGQAVFLPANEPHAYLHGECAECMATSDNTIRAGLTPKFLDVDTLTEMLTYTDGKDWVVSGQRQDNGGIFYDTPIPEFSIVKHDISDTLALEARESSCAILLCIEGLGICTSVSGGQSVNLKPGSCIFVSAQDAIEIKAQTAPLVVFEAYSTP